MVMDECKKLNIYKEKNTKNQRTDERFDIDFMTNVTDKS